MNNGISGKANDFLKILQTESVDERKSIEKEIWNENFRLQKKLEVIKERR